MVNGDYTNYIFSKSKNAFTPLTKEMALTNKAYLPILTSLVSDNKAKETILIYDDEVTGINNLNASTRTNKDAWYTLAGQRIQNPSKKGIYIHHGKKVIIK